MKNKKGFTLIELLAVIAILAVVSVIATRTVLPYMSGAREDAFRIEANTALDSARDYLDLYNLGELDITNDTESCKNGNTVCLSIAKLIDAGLYNADKSTFTGKVMIDITNANIPTYKLYFKKNNEFNIDGGTETDYIDNGTVNSGTWASNDGQAVCSCS